MKPIFILLTLLLIYSCETNITDDIKLETNNPKLVINGGIELNNESPLVKQSITLSSTIGFLDDNDPTPVTNASITVNDEIETYIFNHTENGIYTNNTLQAKNNTMYTITIIWNNETYIGNDTLLEVSTFDKLYAEYEEESLFTDSGYFLKFDSTDPKGIENFYYYRVFKNNEFMIVPDPGNSTTLVEDDIFFDGQQRVGVKPNEEVIYELGDKATAQQLGVSKAYFDYLVTLFVQTGNQGFTFVGNPPPASIRSNIVNTTKTSNKALGYFYTVAVEEKSIIISE